MNNWELFYGKYAKDLYQKTLSVDLSASIVAKILDVEDMIQQESSFPSFVHMKPVYKVGTILVLLGKVELAVT